VRKLQFHFIDVVDELELTPAYDISPQPRSGETTRHPQYGDSGTRDSRIASLVGASPIYHLTANEGQDIADHQVSVIMENWHEVCDAACLTSAQRDSLLGGRGSHAAARPILNPYAFSN